MISRTLQEIQKDIEMHEDAIRGLRKEIETFRSECPHPENFIKKEYQSIEDEYGTQDGGFTTETCLLCGNSKTTREERKHGRGWL